MIDVTNLNTAEARKSALRLSGPRFCMNCQEAVCKGPSAWYWCPMVLSAVEPYNCCDAWRHKKDV